jgi:lysozyme
MAFLLMKTRVLIFLFFLLPFLSKAQEVHASKKKYPARGFDVSAHSGTIQWEKASKGFHFAFIKATEGSWYKDSQFRRNWEKGRKTHLRMGAYHFFKFHISGIKQAENFIENVRLTKKDFPPVVDVEEWGNYYAKTLPTKSIKRELRSMINRLKKHYGRNPIIYSNISTYNRIIKGDFKANPIWIVAFNSQPRLSDGRKWFFWQHSHVARIPGIPHLADLNVFNGSVAQMKAFGK